jgi:hypothetical protein
MAGRSNRHQRGLQMQNIQRQKDAVDDSIDSEKDKSQKERKNKCYGTRKGMMYSMRVDVRQMKLYEYLSQTKGRL